MFRLITSEYAGNEEICIVEDSTSLEYLENKAINQFLENKIQDAYIIHDDIVYEILKRGEFLRVVSTVLPPDLAEFTNSITFISNDVNICVTVYDDENSEGFNSYSFIGKENTIKDLKIFLKNKYKCYLKNISFKDYKDSDIIRNFELIEGSMYKDNKSFDIFIQ